MPTATPESLAEEYRQVNDNLSQVGGDLKAYANETKEKYSEVTARLGAVEQELVSQRGSTSIGIHAGHSVATQAMNAIEEDSAFSHLRGGNIGSCRVTLQASIRAALTNESGSNSSDGSVASQPERRGFVEEAARSLRLLDVLPGRPTSSDSVEYIQLSTTGDASEQDAEGDEKAEIDVDGEPVKAAIATIAAHTTASKQVLSDHGALQGAIDRMVRNKLLSRLEHQLINGSGDQGKIDGLLNQATLLVPSIGSTPADLIGESLTLQADRGYSPNLVILNPLDWFRIQIAKSETEGEYLFGSPTMPIPPALWNAAVVRTASMPEGTALTIDTTYTTVLDREQPSVMLSNSHKDYFTRNLVAILGELRAGLEVLDKRAINKVDLVVSG